MASSNMTLKLLVDKSTQKVLFAEATKEFVDFLFHIFSLPLGTLVHFLGSNQMVGCLGDLKESIENFNQEYLQQGIDKDHVLKVKKSFKRDVLLLSNDVSMNDKPDTPKILYRCSINPCSGHYYDHLGVCRLAHVAEHQGSVCPSCHRLMNVPVTLITSLPNKKDKGYKVVKKVARNKKKLSGGYVKDVVTYMVMDNLVVKPMSTISSITLINSFGVKDLSQLEEKTLQIGKECLIIVSSLVFKGYVKDV